MFVIWKHDRVEGFALYIIGFTAGEAQLHGFLFLFLFSSTLPDRRLGSIAQQAPLLHELRVSNVDNY